MDIRKAVASVGVAAGLAAGGLAATMPAAQADTVSHYGCASKWVCLYTNSSLTSSIVGKYKYYGYDNLSNVLNYHVLQNNQTGGAWAYVCKHYGGTDCVNGIFSFNGLAYTIGDFTPINSIRLSPTSGDW
jgi:hypothetical protein